MWKTLGTFASFFWALTVQPGRVPSRRGKPRWAERCAAYWGVGGGLHCNAISSFEATGEWIHGIANGNGFAMPYRLQRFFYFVFCKTKKLLSEENSSLYHFWLCAGNFAGTQATGADIHAFHFAVNDSPYSLYIGFPCSFGVTVGMADVVAGHDALTAYFTNMCHLVRPPSQNQHIATH